MGRKSKKNRNKAVAALLPSSPGGHASTLAGASSSTAATTGHTAVVTTDGSARAQSESSSSLKRSSPHDAGGDEDGNDWQVIRNGRPVKKLKKTPSAQSSGYPALTFSDTARLQSKLNLSALRDLILYIFADGPGPQWISVRHRPQFRKIVAILVPGLEEAMFQPHVDLSAYANVATAAARTERMATSPDDYYPRMLKRESLHEALRPFADMFPQLWPVRAPGDDKYLKLHSPVQTMLSCPLLKSSKGQKDSGGGTDPSPWRDQRTRITEFLLTSEEYMENGFPPHPAVLPQDSQQRAAFRDPEGWVHTEIATLADGDVPEAEIEQGSVTAGREVLALDCEMCMTGETEYSLTRISVVAWDGEVVLDELVKPDKPITNYVTQFSGITKGMLDPVTTTLRDMQQRLLRLLGPRTILIGHSLDSDLKALQLAHPFIVDTSVLFPHPRGSPLKNSLRHLAQKYLDREIQMGHNTAAGHNSVEDARACLDLVRKKCEKGKAWASTDIMRESLFQRLARAGTAYRTNGGPAATGGKPVGKSSAAVDWGDLTRSGCNAATVKISCNSDAEVEAGIVRAVRGDPDGLEVPGGGVDFVWARMRELEAVQGWWNRNKLGTDEAAAAGGPPDLLATAASAAAATPGSDVSSDVASCPGPILETCLAALSQRLQRIYQALPPCTAFLVFSGTGDPREMSRLQGLQAQFKREYNTLGSKWDQLSVQWTDREDQALRQALRVARSGIGFIGVK